LVAAASVLGARSTLDQAAGLAHIPDPLRALDEAIAVGLLADEPGTVMINFPHPLVQAAVYQQLGAGRRADLHTRAAAMSSDSQTRLHHRVRSATGLDPQLAVELAELGRRAAARGDWAAGGEQLATAARLTAARAASEQLTLEAVECQLFVAQVPDPEGLMGRLLAFPASAWRSYILALMAFVAGRMDELEGLLQDAWRRCDRSNEAALAARIAGLLAILSILQSRGCAGAQWARQALRLAADQPVTDLLRFLELVGLGMSGLAETALASVAALPPPSLATVVELDALAGRGMVRIWTDDLTGACQDLGGLLSSSHDRSAVFRLTVADMLAHVEYRLGRWDDAAVHSEFALSIVEDAGQSWSVPLCRATAALLAAARGRIEQAEDHAQRALHAVGVGCSFVTAYAATAAAQVARARGQPEAVITALRPLRQFPDREGIDEPNVVGWQDLLADAFVAVGEYGQAEEVLAPFEALATQRGRHFAMAAAARARGNLEAARGDHKTADAAFQTGLGHVAQVSMPFEQARLRLAYGAFLRRVGKRTLAAEQLGVARITLSHLKARPDLDRCDRELAACGRAPTPPATAGRPDLTPQELAVARLVVCGLTNQQVARELVVSVKTVEYHLSHVYAKLGVTSRVHLGSRLGEN
jgi:ATP/maltotriose-dependent transcriptional regulator MalT